MCHYMYSTRPAQQFGISFPKKALECLLRDVQLILKFHQLDEIVDQRSERLIVHHYGVQMLSAQRNAILVPLTVFLILAVLHYEQYFGTARCATSRPLAAYVVTLEDVRAEQFVLVRAICLGWRHCVVALH